ncbi:MAG: F0F1 ATP synthase subunit delta [Puniceicoccales bacterium]|jgi:hypothetical protein|nr:F0F1 ATP synthase subunit delta [Puniceicoccales bacterium]
MIRASIARRAARKIVHDLIRSTDPQGALADMFPRVRRLSGRNGIYFLKLIYGELVRLQPYTQDRVESPDGLHNNAVKRIACNFSKHLGLSVVLRNVPNPSLLGGVRVTIGDRRWERSIHSCLETFGKG